jgi:hypothetical protein
LQVTFLKYDRETAPGLAKWVYDQRIELPKEKKTEAAAEKRASLDLMRFEWEDK